MNFPLRCILGFALLVSPLAGTAGERSPVKIIPEPGVWKGASVQDVEAVFVSTASVLWPHAHDQSLAPIRVTNSSGGPIVYYERAENGDYRVKLDTGNTYWAQYAYQFAHEFCHILCHYQEGDKSNLWFEETLCEMASLYALRAMSQTWETHPPYANWKDYRHNLFAYAEERIEKGRLPETTNIKTWLQEHLPELRKNPTDREKNTAVAIALLPLFEEHPDAWAALAFLNAHRDKGGVSFADHLRLWEAACPESSREMVRSIRELLLP